MNPNKYHIPILFLIFNRPQTAQLVFDQIKLLKPKFLFIAADGPRVDRPGEEQLCNETRDIIKQIDWECELKTLFRNENLGCGIAVCSAISWFFEQVEYGIILEDDCLPHLSFFPYCEELLPKYKEEQDVFYISGTNLQKGQVRGNGSYYFSHYASTWGWATWRRAWNYFRHDLVNIDQSFNEGRLDHVFQSSSEKKYWFRKIKNTEKLSHYIWDYQWFFAVWSHKGIGIVPNTNLIVNLGLSPEGTHSFLNDSMRGPGVLRSLNTPLIHPVKCIDRDADNFTFKNSFSHSFSRLFRLTKENGIMRIIKYAISKILTKLGSRT